MLCFLGMPKNFRKIDGAKDGNCEIVFQFRRRIALTQNELLLVPAFLDSFLRFQK